MCSLPIEIVENIISYHQIKDIEVFKLVCKNNFYYAASRVLSFKTPLIVTFKNLIDYSIYDAIMNTSRRFKDLKLFTAGIENRNWPKKQLFNLLRKFGSNIETLEIQHHPCIHIDLDPIRLSTLIEIFGNLKGLKNIKIERKCRIENDYPLSQLPQLDLSHEAIGVIEIASNLNFMPVLELIPNEDKSLIGWELQHVHFDETFEVDSAFFCKWKINKLSNVCEDGEEEKVENFLGKLIATQNMIKELDVDLHYEYMQLHWNLESNLPFIICNNTLLRILDLKASWDRDELPALNKLRNLEELTINISDNFDEEIFQNVLSFMEVPRPTLKVLRLSGSWPTNELMVRDIMSANWPNLQEFEGGLRVETDLNLELFLDALPKLTSLIVQWSRIQSFHLQNGHYPAIRKLHFEHSRTVLLMPPEFIKAFPNLNDLLCNRDVIVSIATMQAILDSKIQKIKLNIELHQSDLIEIQLLMQQIEAKMDSKINITHVMLTPIPSS